MLRSLFAALLLVCLASTAHACTETVVAPCPVNFLEGVKSISVRMHRAVSVKVLDRHFGGRVSAGQVLGGRPAGCPHAFCGCGASLYLFGKIIPSLNLAANWLRFPRATPAPMMAAARRGHVMVLREHLAGPIWLVFDANSGRHLTRVHARSIAGFVVVNPHSASI